MENVRDHEAPGLRHHGSWTSMPLLVMADEVPKDGPGAAIIADVAYLPDSEGVAIRATDSGRPDRPDLGNVDIVGNVLNGEVIKGCESPVEIVYCSEVALPPLPSYTTPPETTITVYGP